MLKNALAKSLLDLGRPLPWRSRASTGHRKLRPPRFRIPGGRARGPSSGINFATSGFQFHSRLPLGRPARTPELSGTSTRMSRRIHGS
jgi:hypothetical protein